jgi:putative transposase
MRKAFPEIKESIEKLEFMMGVEKRLKIWRRIKALHLIKSGLADTRAKIGKLVNVTGKTVGEWLTIYESKGLDEYLTIHTHSNNLPIITGEVLKSLKLELSKPEGFKSYKDIQKWLKVEFHLEVPYSTVYATVRYRLKAKLKVPRPSNAKADPEKQEQFKREGFAEELKKSKKQGL